MPRAIIAGFDTALVHLFGDFSQGQTSVAQLARAAINARSKISRLFRARGGRLGAAGARATQLLAARLGCLQCVFGALRRGLAFMFGNRRVNVQRQFGGFGHIASDELDAAFHQVGDKSDVARKPI